METKGKNSKHHIHFGSGGENSHSHTPAATPASAIGRFPPLKAYSSQSASYLRPVVVTPPSSASLCIWIQKTDVFLKKKKNSTKASWGYPEKKSVNRTVFFFPHKMHFSLQYLLFWNQTLICFGSMWERIGHSRISCCLRIELGFGHSW